MNYSGSTFPLANNALYKAIFNLKQRSGPSASLNPVNPGAIICTYAIDCHATNQAYVGSTENFYVRWVQHKNALNRGTHKNVLLQEAFDAHGAEAFSIRILAVYPATSGLLRIEREDALKHYKQEDLFNGRIGMMNIFTYPRRNDPRPRTVNPGKQTKSRWYTGEATL